MMISVLLLNLRLLLSKALLVVRTPRGSIAWASRHKVERRTVSQQQLWNKRCDTPFDLTRYFSSLLLFRSLVWLYFDFHDEPAVCEQLRL